MATDNGGNAGGNGSGNSGNGDGGQDKKPETQTFTQVDVDRVVGERIARERKSFAKDKESIAAAAREAFLEELGLDPAEDGAVDGLREMLKKNITADGEAKKSQRQLDALRKDHEKALAKLAAIESREKRTMHTADVIARIKSDYEGALELSDDGAVLARGESIDKAVKILLEKNPHLLKPVIPQGGGGSRFGAGGPGQNNDALLTSEGRRASLMAAGFMTGGGQNNTEKYFSRK
jgi:hypothetical protein